MLLLQLEPSLLLQLVLLLDLMREPSQGEQRRARHVGRRSCHSRQQFCEQRRQPGAFFTPGRVGVAEDNTSDGHEKVARRGSRLHVRVLRGEHNL